MLPTKKKMDANLLAMLSTFDDKHAYSPGSTCTNDDYERKSRTFAKDLR